MSTYRRMRRQARQARRSGLQPMMVINSGEPFPETAGVVLLRWAWRYRSELAPLAVTARHRGGRLVAARRAAALVGCSSRSLAGVAAWAVATLRRAVADSPTLIERVYAATTIYAAGVWLSAATALGPFASPLPQALVIGALILSVPWWAHRRRRAKVRVERKLQAWPDIAKAIGLAGSQVMSATVDVWGWRARFRLARGQTITDVVAKIPAIESGLGTFRGAVRVYPTPDDLANRCEIRVLDVDPHAGSIPWPGPSVTSITQPIDLGPFEDASPCRVLFMRRHGLFGGATGSGKSGGLNVLMGNLVACRDVVIWAIDLKKGMELRPWQSCIARLATTPEQAMALLRDAVAILEARAELLAAAGKRTWEISPDMPALVIIIDEYAELADEAPDAMQRYRFHRPAWPCGRRYPDRRYSAADAKGHGPRRGALPDGPTDMFPRPRAQGRRPGPRAGHAPRRLGCPQPQRTRKIPRLRTRARYAETRTRLPPHRPGRRRNRRALCRQPSRAGRGIATRDSRRKQSTRRSAEGNSAGDSDSPDADRSAMPRPRRRRRAMARAVHGARRGNRNR